MGGYNSGNLQRYLGGGLTLVLDKLVEEAGFPRPGAADYQELKQEV